MYIILALMLSLAGSYWIDTLYKLPNTPLMYPESKIKRAMLRKPILIITSIFFAIYFENVEVPLNIYLIITSIFLVMITLTDFEQYIIFDKMLIVFAIIGLTAIYNLNLPLTDRLIAALAGGGFFLLLAIITKGAIGGGDIKLMFVLGIYFGIDNLLTICIAGFILSGTMAAILLAVKLKQRGSYIAYSPYFTLSALYILIKNCSF